MSPQMHAFLVTKRRRILIRAGWPKALHSPANSSSAASPSIGRKSTCILAGGQQLASEFFIEEWR